MEPNEHIAMRSLQDHFLVAMPAMGDPNFNGTVTYLCKHDDEGALGLVINRPTELTLGEVFKQLKLDVSDTEQAAKPVLRGGPVGRDRGFVLHQSAHEFETTLETGGSRRLTAFQDIMAALARGDVDGPVLVALGYAGWAPGQIEAEIAANAWLVVPADRAILFETPYEQRWAAAVGLLGVDVHQITSYAGHA
jgi:putative transcriptional regulator